VPHGRSQSWKRECCGDKGQLLQIRGCGIILLHDGRGMLQKRQPAVL